MKISGNTQFVLEGNLATHGTLLFNTDLTVLNKALVTNKHKIEAKGIPSNKMRVTNIKNHILSNIDSEEFVNKLIEYFVENGNGVLHEIPKHIIDKSIEMSKEMKTLDWIYDKSPVARISNKIKYPSGNISTFLDVVSGKIKNLQIYGDSFLSRMYKKFVKC